MKLCIFHDFKLRNNLEALILFGILMFSNNTVLSAVTNKVDNTLSDSKPSQKKSSFTFRQARESEEICNMAFDRLYSPIKASMKDIAKKDDINNTDFSFIKSDCKHPEKRLEFIEKLNFIISHHSESIILIVQKSSDPFFAQIQAGFQTVLKHKKFSNLKFKIIELEAQPSDAQLKTIFFTYYYQEKPSIFFIAHSEDINEKLYALGKQVKMPIILLTSHKLDKSNKVYSLQPRQDNLAKSLAKFASKKYRKIGILASAGSLQSEFTQNFISEAQLSGSETQVQSFDPTNFNSLNSAISIFFKRKSINKLSALNEETSLPQTIDQMMPNKNIEEIFEANIDALFLPDDFKIVHHVLRILDFYGIKKLPLLGGPKWRSPGIIQYKHGLINGAIIVDYIGRKQSLPNHLRTLVNSTEDDVFFNSEILAKAEGYFIGFKAGLLASKLELSSKTSRLSLLAKYKSIHGQNIDTILAHQWPEIFFEIKDGRGSLISTGSQTPISLQ